jgi:hypothetical protein
VVQIIVLSLTLLGEIVAPNDPSSPTFNLNVLGETVTTGEGSFGSTLISTLAEAESVFVPLSSLVIVTLTVALIVAVPLLTPVTVPF